MTADPITPGTVAVVLADSGLKYLSTDLWPGLEVPLTPLTPEVPEEPPTR